MTTMTMTVAQEWTDGITLVRREGRQVTVQILGDVYRRFCGDEDEAAVMFAAEVATEEERGEQWDAGAATRRDYADDGEVW